MLMMDQFQPFARILIIVGIIFVAAGVLLLCAGKIPWFGKLPGDIVIQKKNFTLYIPIVTSIALSLLLTLILFLIRRR